ncbi:MAG: hypothetical protein R3D88_09350 [Alphaproteobacteria bacterium]|nr:hypothetical protein [Alphaproteobacteria bacterium]
MLTHIQLIQLCSFSILLTVGQILFKLTAISAPPLNNIQALISLTTNLWFWGALILYGAATLLWIFILQNVSLSLAYPFTALGFILIPLVSYIIFKEPITWQYSIGVVLILIALKFIMTGR